MRWHRSASCSASRCSRSRSGSPSARRSCSASRSRSAPSSPAWCSASRSSRSALPRRACRCAKPLPCCSSSRSACCSTRASCCASRWRCSGRCSSCWSASRLRRSLIVMLFRHTVGVGMTIAASLSQIGEFSFILAGLGVAMGILPEQGRDLVLAAAMISIVLNPFAFALTRAAAAAARSARARPSVDAARRCACRAATASWSATGGWASRRGGARASGKPFVVIESDAERIRELRERSIPVRRGQCREPRDPRRREPGDGDDRW